MQFPCCMQFPFSAYVVCAISFVGETEKMARGVSPRKITALLIGSVVVIVFWIALHAADNGDTSVARKTAARRVNSNGV